MQVLVCGDSLLLREIADVLRAAPGLSVVHADTCQPSSGSLAAFQADVLIVDQAEALAHGLPELIHLRPGLPVLGLDTDGSRLLLFSGAQCRPIDPSALPAAVQELEARR